LDLSVIEDEVKYLLTVQKGWKLILGQIISGDYTLSLAEEINELLMKKGTVSVEELSTHFELPPEFVKQVSHLNVAIASYLHS